MHVCVYVYICGLLYTTICIYYISNYLFLFSLLGQPLTNASSAKLSPESSETFHLNLNVNGETINSILYQKLFPEKGLSSKQISSEGQPSDSTQLCM